MEHIAIDLWSRESQICIRDEKGTILLERKVATAKLPGYLGKRPHSRVILETCAEAFHVADAATAAGHQVRVVPATLVRQLGVGERGIKTDEREARKLSEVSTRIDLPSVHVPSESSRERKRLCNSATAVERSCRIARTSSTTSAVNSERTRWCYPHATRLRFPSKCEQRWSRIPMVCLCISSVC
jgi:transposase